MNKPDSIEIEAQNRGTEIIQGHEGMHGLRFDMDFNCYYWEMAANHHPTIEDVQYLMERVRRAEAKNKPVTEGELREMFEDGYMHPDGMLRNENGHYIEISFQRQWEAFKRAFELFGKLREEK